MNEVSDLERGSMNQGIKVLLGERWGNRRWACLGLKVHIGEWRERRQEGWTKMRVRTVFNI